MDHMGGHFVMHDDAIVATTDLLYREVQKLKNLDLELIIGSNKSGEAEQGVSTSRLYPSARPSILVPDVLERMASKALALIMERLHNVNQCIETAVRAVSFHVNKSGCKPDLVVAATKWFLQAFLTPEGPRATTSQEQLLRMCGYARILAAMAVYCTEPAELAARFFDRNEVHPEGRLHEDVEWKIRLLAEVTHDMNLRAFGASTLAVWRFACSNETFKLDAMRRTLDDIWSLIAKQDAYKLRPEALEALLDAVGLLTVVSEPAVVISSSEAQALLLLLSLLKFETEERVQPALGVALTICGLCLDANDWDFWTPAERKRFWREYTWPRTRRKASPALYLVGLSRLLAHYESLMLNHTSINTIAVEIGRYMKKHANRPSKRLTLSFLPGNFDVRRHVRECVWEYLRATESQAPFTKSMAASRDELRTAVQYDGGEGFLYEAPQPFARTRSP
ncbi:hypothetical protein FRC07_004243, partial [Ceratobasidium sp. 392]